MLATTTIVGPAGVSKKNAPIRPQTTERAPIKLANNAIFSGVLASFLAIRDQGD